MSDCISEPDNPSLVYCPRCRNPLQRIGRFLVCPAHGVVESQAAVMARQTPLRLFLSYGHDANEELVSRIRSDLEQRGHDVWFDRNEIRPGDDWRRAITDGIISSDKFISFLSKHSTRDPGVCRDEIAIAIGVKGGNIQTILVESEHEVQPPVSIGHIQWLDMHDWKEWRDVGGAEWEEWYQSRFAEIVRVVECDESRRFSGEIEALSSDLKPVRSDTRIAALLSRGFCGRHWLSRALEDWRTQQPRGSRLFWITGAPGVGKSAFAAQLAHSGSDMVVAAHFCDWAMADHRDARRVIRSLAFQLATRIPDYRRLLLTLPEIAELDGKDAATLFDYLLATPLRSVIHGHRERYLIVIDAVDEAGDGGRNALVEILSRYAPSLPDWIGVVVTSRPEFDVVCALQSLQPYSLDARSESNREDLREYLWAQLAEPLQHVPDADRLVERILDNCEGVFLYVERFCEDVQCGHLSLNAPELFPQGLGGIYVQYFQRMFPDPEHFRRVVRPALRMILAAFEPLPLDMLQRQFEWTIEELHDFLRLVASLFPRQRLSGQDVIKPAHRSIADWLSVESRSGPWFVSVAEGHRQLADVCWRQFEQSEQGVEEMTPYALSHLVAHLISDARWDSIASVLRHLPYCEARVRAGESFALADDFRDAISAWPEDRAERRPLELLHEALCRDLHFIAGHAADYPQALFQSVWNSAWWYDSAAAADHYQTAADDMDAAPAGKGMPISGRLSELLEQWRGEGRGGRRGPWLRALRPPHLQLGSGQLVSLRGHRGAVNSVAYSSDGRRLLTASADGTARLWDARNGQELRVLSGHAGEVNVAGFSRDGFRIVTGSDDGSVRLWDSDTGRETAVLHGHRNWIRGAAFLEQDRTVVSCSDDHTVRLWDRESGRETAVLQGHEGIVYAVAAAPDNRLLVSGSYDQTLRLWDVASASELAVLGGHEDTVRCVAFSPNGRWIASGSDDRTVRLWNVVTGRVTQILRGHDRNVRSVAFSPDGQRIVSGSYDNTARVWDTESGQLMAVLQGHDDWVKGVTFSPDGRQVATASRDQTAQTWKSAGGRIPAVLHGHQGCILDVAFSPNGRRVISRDEYGELLAWDAVSGRVLRPTPADSVALVQRRSSSLTGRVSLENGETVISLTAGMPAVVRFPAALQDLQVHPEGSRWAGGVGSHLVLLQLENAPAGSEGQSTG